jgi:hypothetical protein
MPPGKAGGFFMRPCYNAGMSEGPKRRWFQFRLMLLLLVVALFGSLIAWLNAIKQRSDVELGIQQINLHTRLDHLEKASAQGHRDLQGSKDIVFRRQLANNLRRIDSDISELKRELGATGEQAAIQP